MISAFGYAWKNRRFGGTFPLAYQEAKDRESFTFDQWHAHQSEQLQKLLTHAIKEVPYYLELYKKAGLTAAKLRHIEADNLQKVPVLPKDDLRKFGSSSLLSASRGKGSFFSSSGSTGTPVKIFYSHAMHQQWFGIYEARIRNWAGVSSFIPRGMIGGRRIIPGAIASPPYYRYNYFEKQVYCSAYHINAANAANYLEGLKKYNVTYMTGYAMSNFFLARFFKENNLEAPSLKAVITSSEKLNPDMRKLFAEVYQCKTYDSWGSVEACGIVSECEMGNLHVSPDAGIIELLDENMQPVAPGQPGDVYCTGLLNTDQPLIRYAIGDRMVWKAGTCSCGRQMPMIEEVVGRTEDVVVGKDGREMVRFHSIFYGLEKIKKSQVVQQGIGELLIKLEVEKPLSAAENSLLKQRIESQLGEMDISIEEVDIIPLNRNGKFQAVISKVKRSEKG